MYTSRALCRKRAISLVHHTLHSVSYLVYDAVKAAGTSTGFDLADCLHAFSRKWNYRQSHVLAPAAQTASYIKYEREYSTAGLRVKSKKRKLENPRLLTGCQHLCSNRLWYQPIKAENDVSCSTRQLHSTARMLEARSCRRSLLGREQTNVAEKRRRLPNTS